MIWMTGDIHGEFTRFMPSRLSYFLGTNKLTKNDYVIALGDFGLFWENYPSKEEINVINFLNNLPFTTLWIDGNHENFSRIKLLPEVEIFGGRAGRISDSIFHLRRGEIYVIDGIKFFVFGGGLSIDKNQRIPDISWWKDEEPSYAEYKNGLVNINIHGFNVDYILSHECPGSIYPHFGYDYWKSADYSLPKYFDEIRKKVYFKHWYFAHHHIDKQFEEKFTCIYRKAIRIEK